MSNLTFLEWERIFDEKGHTFYCFVVHINTSPKSFLYARVVMCSDGLDRVGGLFLGGNIFMGIGTYIYTHRGIYILRIYVCK